MNLVKIGLAVEDKSRLEHGAISTHFATCGGSDIASDVVSGHNISTMHD